MIELGTLLSETPCLLNSGTKVLATTNGFELKAGRSRVHVEAVRDGCETKWRITTYDPTGRPLIEAVFWGGRTRHVGRTKYVIRAPADVQIIKPAVARGRAPDGAPPPCSNSTPRT